MSVTTSHVVDLAWLRITLTDVNDNAPKFLKPYYTVKVLEGTCSSTEPLATITAVDYDLPDDTLPEGQKGITFKFASNGNPGNRFQLRDSNKNSTYLYCTGSINREATPDLKVVITATDNAAPKPSSTVNVFVHVEDRDQTAASSAKMQVIVFAIEGKFPGGRIAKTYFKDNDGDSDITGMKYMLTGTM